MIYHELNQQRRIEIEQGLLQLMKKRPYSEITVKDLAEHLQFVRKTFYHYFPSKQACLESLTDRLIYDGNLYLLQTLPPHAGLLQTYEARLGYWKEHREFLECMIRNRMSDFLLERFLQYLQKEEPGLQTLLSTPEVEYDEDILFFYISGQIYLLLKWCAEGFPLSVEEMALKNLRLVSKPLILSERGKCYERI